jgi:hypothetical protein
MGYKIIVNTFENEKIVLRNLEILDEGYSFEDLRKDITFINKKNDQYYFCIYENGDKCYDDKKVKNLKIIKSWF